MPFPAEPFGDGGVGGHKVKAGEFCGGHPPVVSVFGGGEAAAGPGTKIGHHQNLPLGVSEETFGVQVAYLNLDTEFFQHFAGQGLFAGFARIDFPPGNSHLLARLSLGPFWAISILPV